MTGAEATDRRDAELILREPLGERSFAAGDFPLSIGGEADAVTFTLSGFSRALRQAQANCTSAPTLP